MKTVLSKSAVSSKTVIVNAVVILLACVTALTDANIPFVSEQLQSETAIAILAVVNVILRFFTKQPVTVTGGEPVPVEDRPL